MTTFRGEQYDLAYPEGVDGHFWTVARNRIVARLVAGAPAGPVVLDVGCGRGLTVDFLRKAGVDCRGVELAGVEPLPDVRPFVSASQDAFALPAAARLFDLEQRLLPAGWYGTSLWGVADR